MKNHTFFHPKFIPTWILFGIMWLAAKLPIKSQILLGNLLGAGLFLVLSRHRKIALINIKLCFPQKNKNEVRQLLKRHFKSLGIGFFEVANTFFLADEQLKKRYTITNSKHLKQALKAQKNIILLVGHFSTMFIAGRIMAQNFKFADIYRPQNNQLFDYMMQKYFKNHGASMVKSRDLKNILKTLKSGLPIWYAHDQDLGANKSSFAPFFGIQTATINATIKLAKIPNTVVIPLSFYRQKQGYVLDFAAPLDNFSSLDKLAAASATNQILEAQIRQAPEQYLWIHRRFKTRPAGEQSFYLNI